MADPVTSAPHAADADPRPSTEPHEPPAAVDPLAGAAPPVGAEPVEQAPPIDPSPVDPPPVEPAVVIPAAYPVRPPSRRVLMARVGLGIAVVATLLGGPAAVAVDRSWLQSQDRSALTVRQPAESVGDGSRSGNRPKQAPARSPRAGEPGTARHSPARTKIQSVLDAQSAALLRGDEAAFLAPADQANAGLVGDLRRRFAVLRAMNVAGWAETLAADPEPVDGGWRASVRLGYCFAVAGCDPVAVPVTTRWAEANGQLRLVEFGSSGGSDLGPRPWEVSDLRVAVGSRVVVAAPPRYAGRVQALLDAAEEAAAITDRYAKWASPPGRYVVYLAGPDEWGSWYGVRQAEWVAGYAMPITERHTEIVLNAQRVTGGEVLDTLRHEFAHVVTLADVRRDYSGQWWLVEGIAEYVRMVGRPLREYELLSASRRYVRGGNPTDLASLAEPAAKASTDEASGRYGVAFLTVRRLAERFGEDRLLRFFDKVVRHGTPPAEAATAEFGTGWDGIVEDCSRYTRRSLS
jgi:hypothetical protein